MMWTMPEVGKQYRLDVRISGELVCSNCQVILGAKKPPEVPRIVTVIESAEGHIAICPECKHSKTLGEGWFRINFVGRLGYNVAVPYTWLVPIEDEVPA